MLFKYKIKTPDGKEAEGTMEAADKYALYHNLKKDGSTILSSEEVKQKSGLFADISLPFIGGVGEHDKIIFARNLGQMIEAGLPITRGLSIMERQAKKNSTLKKVLTSLNDALSKGNTLSEAMKAFPNVFNTLFVSMVKAGEESGNLSSALNNIALQLEKSYQLSRKIRGAMMYPAVILSLMVVIGVLMMVYMVPTLTETFTGLNIQLPLPTRIIIGISNILKNYLLVIIGLVIALIVGTVMFLRTKTGMRTMDTVSLHFPIVSGIVKEMNSARTARTLSSLISSGVDIVVAISVTREVVQNSYYREVLDEVQTAIQKGDQISAIFLSHDKLYPLFVGEMVSVGEETGRIGEMLLGVATFYEDEVDQKTKDMSTVIEPILMIIIGVAVGFFAISMLAPTYSLANSI